MEFKKLFITFIVFFVCNVQAQFGNYTVAADPYSPPFVYTDTQNKMLGFDMDILNAIAAQEGVKLTFKTHPWKGLFDTLNNGGSDIIISGITITSERRKAMDFTNPYFESKKELLFNPKALNIQSLEQLKDLRVAVKGDTTSDTLVKKIGNADKIQRANSIYGAIKDMLMKKSDAVLGDLGSITYYKKKYPNLGLKVMTDPNWPIEQYGFAVRKGNTELLDKLNNGLKIIKNNGIYDKIYKKWFSD